MKLKELKENVVYHGTTEIAWLQIQQEGLNPQTDPSSMFRGNMSTIKGYTETLVYLTDSKSKAEYYASEQADDQGSSAVILAIKSNALRTELLRPDDDIVLVSLADEFDTDEDDVSDQLNGRVDGEVTLDDVNKFVKKWKKKAVGEFAYAGNIPINSITKI